MVVQTTDNTYKAWSNTLTTALRTFNAMNYSLRYRVEEIVRGRIEYRGKTILILNENQEWVEA